MSDEQRRSASFWWRHRAVLQIGGGVAVIMAVTAVGALIFQGQGYWLNVLTEGLGVGVTILVLNRLAAFREEARETARLQRRLVREASSTSNETAKAAIDWLRAEKWLIGEAGLLQGVDLSRATLQDADLWKANLRAATLRETDLHRAELSNCDFTEANLRQADLRETSLKHANFDQATLRNARLNGANMRYANLRGANLRGADLTGADLQEADLTGANLRAANLTNAKGLATARCDEETCLPDGSYWLAELDWVSYTHASELQT